MTEAVRNAPWALVVPVKGGRRAKSRLGPRAGLARAIAADTLAAVFACPRVAQVVVVLGPDADDALVPRPEGPAVEIVRQVGEGLGAALEAGVRRLRAMRPWGPAAVLLGDLPALTPTDLATALDVGRQTLRGTGPHQAFVPDARGSGTVLLLGRRPDDLRPAFGTGSAAAHAAMGAVRLEPALPRLRQDVDTAEDLRAAAEMGLGPRTRAVLGADALTGPPSTGPRTRP